MMAMAPTLSASDRLAIGDTLLRFGQGTDAGDPMLIASAFTSDAEVDFSPCGQRLGLDFGVVRGRDAITGFLAGTTARQVTSHAVTNMRVAVAGDAARLSALVDAVHIVRDGSIARFQMMNHYDAEVVSQPDGWAMRRVRIVNLWFEGDPQALVSR